MLKEITIKVPEESIPEIISLVSIMLKYTNNDPYINNNLLNGLVVVDKDNIINNNQLSNTSKQLNNNLNKDKFSNYEVGYIPSYEEVIDYIFYKHYENKIDAYDFFEQLSKANWIVKNQKVRFWTKMIDYFVANGWCSGTTKLPEVPTLPESVAK